MLKTTVDLVTRREDGTFVMVLVEEGPWLNSHEDHLRVLQGRLYDYLDIVIDGGLAAKFPESDGASVEILVDALNTPSGVIPAFVRHFESAVRSSHEYSSSIGDSSYVNSVVFDCAESPGNSRDESAV